MSSTVFLQPVLALVLWTLVMWVWLYATRIPAMQKAKIDPQEAVVAADGSWKSKIPNHVHWVADNYNHLHEQPTIFYALMLFVGATGGGGVFTLALGWIYVGLRIVHSLIQATINRVMLRFMVFALSSIVLVILAIGEAIRVFF